MLLTPWRKPSKPPSRPAFRPHIEVLEGRCLPSTVTNLNDAGAGSLRQAILDTPAGGTVDFQEGLAGTITLTSGELLLTKDLTVAGPGADVITVSGNHASRVFDITTNLTVAISGLTVANGQTDTSGGGIWKDQGTLTVTAVTLSGNSATTEGGGIFNSGTLTVTASTLSGNSALEGGGIYNYFSGALTVTASTLSGNSGGVFYGGGIYNLGALTVTASTLSGNFAAGSGGGIFNGGTLTVTASTLSGNSARGAGGGIYNFSGLLTVTASTLSGNSATSGGGICNSSGNVAQIRNTILALNTAPTGPELDGAVGSLGHNLIGDGTGGGGYDPTDQVGTPDSPIDPLLGPLQDNGGPTQTMALLCGSPAIDAGDNAGAPDFDQRGEGFPRVVGVLDPGNPVIDIGAYEVQDGECAGPAPRGPRPVDPLAQPLLAAPAPGRVAAVRVPVVSIGAHPDAVPPRHAMESPAGQAARREGTSIARALARRDAAFAAWSIEDGLLMDWR